MILHNKYLFREMTRSLVLAGFLSITLIAFFSLSGCGGGGGGGGGSKGGFALTGYDGEDSHAGNSGLELYTEFPWFVNLTFQAIDLKAKDCAATDLTVEDFKVLEDGTEVDQIESEMNIRKRDTLPSPYTYTLKTVLLLDNTPSSNANLETILEGAQDMDEKHQQEIAMVAFDAGGDPYLVSDFTDNFSTLYQYLNTASENAIVASPGTTNFYGAVRFCLNLWENSLSPAETDFVQGILVVITDGKDTSELYDVDDAIALRDKNQKNKQVITVAVGADILPQVLDDLEDLGNFGFYEVPQPVSGKGDNAKNLLAETLVEVQCRIIAYADSFYRLRYKSDSTSKDADTDHDVVLSVVRNSHSGADATISGSFSSEDFVSRAADIYFNATAADPDGDSEAVLSVDSGDAPGSVTVEVTAVTYSRDSNNPSEYEWSSGNTSVVTVKADTNDDAKATLTAVAPGETQITVTDKANNVTQKLTVRVELKAPSYEFIKHGLQSAYPWFVDATFQIRETYDEADYDEDNPWLNHWDWITDLEDEDFSILENEGTAEEYLIADQQSRQKSEVNLRKHDDLPSNYTYTLKTVLLIDNSPSIGGEVLNTIKDAAKAFVNRAFVNNSADNTDFGPLLSKQGDIQQEIAVWTFTEDGDSTTVWLDFSTVEADINTAIDAIPQGFGATDFYGGMIDALNLWENDQWPRNDGNTAFQQGVLVALTDGNHSFQGFSTREAVLGEVDDRQVICVGIGDDLAFRANVEDLMDFGNAGYYSVPNPGQESEVTLTSDSGTGSSKVTYTSLEKTLMDIQDVIFDYANSFYWLEYKSYVEAANDCEDKEAIKIYLNNNSNTAPGRVLGGFFESCEFFDGIDNYIYVNATVTNPYGIDEVELTYVMLGSIPMTDPTYPLEAFTYDDDGIKNEPFYEWDVINENIAVITVDTGSYANSRATLGLPAVKQVNDTTLIINDTGNVDDTGHFPYRNLPVSVSKIQLPGPLAYYPFNGNADDETGHGYDGEVFGATLTADRNGKPSSAYSFDGVDDYIALDAFYGPGAGAIGPTFDEITVCAWFKTSDASKSMRIISFNYENFWELYIHQGKPVIGANIDGQVKAIRTTNTYSDGQWHFVAATIDMNGDMKIMVDGTSDFQSYDIANPVSTANRYGFIGARSETDVYNGERYPVYFFGEIDDVIVFDQVLTDDVIQLLETAIK